MSESTAIQPFNLTAYRLLITLEATEPIALEKYAGSSLRGALYEGLLRRFCTNPAAESCGECPLNTTCPVAGLVAPLRDERLRGRDVPRPFVIAPASGIANHQRMGDQSQTPVSAESRRSTHDEVRLEAGQTYSFTVTLFGHAVRYFPYLALSLPMVASQGIGRPLRDHHGRRGRPRVVTIEAVQPFTGERETLYHVGDQSARKPTLAITPAAIAAHAATLPSDRLLIRFTTPTRLIAEKRLLPRPDARILALRLAERLEALQCEYGSGATSYDERGDDSREAARVQQRERYLAIARAVQDIRVLDDETHWVDVNSYSSRQRKSMPIGGFIGHATLTGELGPLRELFVWGEVAHAGKNAVKGDGCLRIEALPCADAGATKPDTVEKFQQDIALGI